MKLAPEEYEKGELSEERLVLAVETLCSEGYVVLENAVPETLVEEIRETLNPILQDHVEANPQMLNSDKVGHGIFGLHPPREMPFMDPLIIANPFARSILAQVLGADFFCAFYNTNTSWPGSGIQNAHRDSPPLVADHPHPLPAYSIVLNIPLIDFSAANGATEIWPSTHLDNRSYPQGINDYDEWAAQTPAALTEVPIGSLILRDMRMWHRGMPNRTGTIRTMLAVVYNRLFYDFDRQLEISGAVWEEMSEEAQEIFRFNSIVED